MEEGGKETAARFTLDKYFGSFLHKKKGKYKSPVEADSRQRTTNGGRATGFLWAALSAPSPLRLLPICQRPRLLFLIEKTLIDAELSDLNERIP